MSLTSRLHLEPAEAVGWAKARIEVKAAARLDNISRRSTIPGTRPWVRVLGKAGWDGKARVSTAALMDLLEVPQQARRAPVFRRLAKIMAELGWSAVRVRDLTRGGYKEQVRGYCRDARHERPPL